MLFALFIALVLILINALYVAAEFGSVAVRRAQVAHLAHTGNENAKQLLPFVQEAPKLDTYVAACQIGITVSSLILGAFADAAFSPAIAKLLSQYSSIGEVTAYSISAIFLLVLFTCLQVIFGELVPKSLALRFPLKTALNTIRPMLWSLMLFRPFIRVLNGSGIFLLRLLRVPLTTHRHVHSVKEIESILLHSRRSGSLAPEQYQRLREALRLPLTKAHQLMVPRMRVDAINASWPVSRCIDAILLSPYTRLPVYEQTLDNLIGFVHTTEVTARFARGSLQSITEAVRPAVFVPEMVAVDRLLNLFREQHTHLAFVVDELGEFTGLISIEDVLSELLGDIPDELKRPRVVQSLARGKLRFPGEMRREMVSDWLGIEWPGDADTISGHIANILCRIPRKGEMLVIAGTKVTVESVENNAVTSIIVEVPDTVAEQGGSEPK